MAILFFAPSLVFAVVYFAFVHPRLSTPLFEHQNLQSLSAGLTALSAYTIMLTYTLGELHFIFHFCYGNLMRSAAYLLFPQFLGFGKFFVCFGRRYRYHRTHISRMRDDRFRRLMHGNHFTIFVLGASDKSVPIGKSLL
jgi:hypothetical protein